MLKKPIFKKCRNKIEPEENNPNLKIYPDKKQQHTLKGEGYTGSRFIAERKPTGVTPAARARKSL